MKKIGQTVAAFLLGMVLFAPSAAAQKCWDAYEANEVLKEADVLVKTFSAQEKIVFIYGIQLCETVYKSFGALKEKELWTKDGALEPTAHAKDVLVSGAESLAAYFDQVRKFDNISRAAGAYCMLLNCDTRLGTTELGDPSAFIDIAGDLVFEEDEKLAARYEQTAAAMRNYYNSFLE